MTDRLRFDRFELNVDERTLAVDGAPAAIGARAFDVLVALIERRNRVVPKGELLDVVWPGVVVEENNLQVQVSTLRKLLGAGVIVTVAGRGYRFTAAPASTSAAAPAAPASSRSNLPPARTRFVGRESALADGTRLVAASRLLTLTGIGGCGKTRLALELAGRHLDAFADGVWFIDLAPVQDGARVASVVASTLGVRESAGTTLHEQLRAHAATRRMLLVVDNCEHVIDAVVEVVEALLGAGDGVRIVATSREAFGLAGEQIYPVRSLALPASAALDAVRECESVRVFVDRARLVVPDFDLDAGNAAGVAEICRRLDGIALAIELAAARLAMLSVEDIRARLDDRFRLLSGGGRALPRHQTLQAMMLWSYLQLSAAEQTLFRRLSVFVGGSTLGAAAAVAGDDDHDEYRTLELLTALHHKSLVIVERDGGAAPRYRMLETVRQYAQDRLDESGESADLRRRHVEHCVAWTEEAAAAYTGTRQGEINVTMRIEQGNLLAAHDWSAHVADSGGLGLRLAAACWRYMVSSDQLELGRRMAEDALRQASPDIERPARARLLVGLATIHYYMGRYRDVMSPAEEGIALARSVGDLTHVTNGLVILNASQPEAAGTPLYEARDAEIDRLARSLDDKRLIARSFNHLAEGRRARGRHAEAAAYYEEALAAARESGNPGTSAVLSCNFSRLSVAAGRPDRARELLREATALTVDNELRGMSQHLFEAGAGLAVLLGDARLAARLNGAALARMRDSGARREPVDEQFIAPLMQRARAALGDEAFELEEGAGLTHGIDGGMLELRAWLQRSG